MESGFLNSGDDLVRGNQGMKDLIMGLKWVQGNIRNFSGDPNSVTIFGESAGGGAVHYLMLSPLSKGKEG
jgi:carboxylesterase type B